MRLRPSHTTVRTGPYTAIRFVKHIPLAARGRGRACGSSTSCITDGGRTSAWGGKASAVIGTVGLWCPSGEMTASALAWTVAGASPAPDPAKGSRSCRSGLAPGPPSSFRVFCRLSFIVLNGLLAAGNRSGLGRHSPVRATARRETSLGVGLCCSGLLCPLLTSVPRSTPLAERSALFGRHPHWARDRPPEVSSTAFNARPPDLHPVPLMDGGLRDCWLARPARHA